MSWPAGATGSPLLGGGPTVDVAVTRVPVPDGHMAHVFLRLAETASPAAVAALFRRSGPHDVALTLLVHNLVQGAAGACLANAELLEVHGGRTEAVFLAPGAGAVHG